MDVFCAWPEPGSLKLVGSADLVKKVYFPRLAIPIAAVLSGGRFCAGIPRAAGHDALLQRHTYVQRAVAAAVVAAGTGDLAGGRALALGHECKVS